jgi:hypothetical protein
MGEAVKSPEIPRTPLDLDTIEKEVLGKVDDQAEIIQTNKEKLMNGQKNEEIIRERTKTVVPKKQKHKKQEGIKNSKNRDENETNRAKFDFNRKP